MLKTVAMAMLMALSFSVSLSSKALAAGGVVGEAGSCAIKMGFYSVHFTLYQPETSANDEFCDVLPDAGETLFVLDYLHDSLKEVPVDFRIIKDVTGKGQFAKWQHVQEIKNIENHTVFYQPAIVRPEGRLTVQHSFADQGSYIGVVSASHPTKDVVYHAVFPFEIGNTGFGYWLWIVAAVVVLQLIYFVSTGALSQLRIKRKRA